MLTLKFFQSLFQTFSGPADHDLRTWARIEFKRDAEYAYTHMKEFGVAPVIGVHK